MASGQAALTTLKGDFSSWLFSIVRIMITILALQNEVAFCDHGAPLTVGNDFKSLVRVKLRITNAQYIIMDIIFCLLITAISA